MSYIYFHSIIHQASDSKYLHSGKQLILACLRCASVMKHLVLIQCLQCRKLPYCTHLCPEICHPGQCPLPEQCCKKVIILINHEFTDTISINECWIRWMYVYRTILPTVLIIYFATTTFSFQGYCSLWMPNIEEGVAVSRRSSSLSQYRSWSQRYI